MPAAEAATVHVNAFKPGSGAPCPSASVNARASAYARAGTQKSVTALQSCVNGILAPFQGACMAEVTAERRDIGDILVIGFGTTIAMWGAGYLLRLPGSSAPG